MDALVLTAAALALLLGLAVWAWLATWRRMQAEVQRLEEALREMDSRKRSQSTRYGQITEQFAPFLTDWPWDPKRFRFLGDPIDGVQFTDEGVVFVEIKTNQSRLSPVQRQVRDLVQAGRVYWHEMRIE